MFRTNNDHNQASIFGSTQFMDQRVAKKLEKTWAPIYYEYVFRKIDETPFAVLYDTIGQPNFPVNILLSLEYFKHMKDCNDLELMDSYNFDYLVNHALGLRTLGELNLSERTLYNFRRRVYDFCVENPCEDDLLFGPFIDLVNGFAGEAGISLDKQRVDTTLFMSNIKKAGRLSLAYDVLVKGVKAIPEGNLTEALSNVLKSDFKTDVLYRSKAQEKDSKLAQLLKLCNEALQVLISLADIETMEEVRILRRFLKEQSTRDEKTGEPVPKPNKEIESGSLQSAYDEDATYRKKGDVAQSGYVLEIVETCDKGNPFQLITDYAVEPNNVADATILGDRMDTIHKNTGCTDMYGDGGFHSETVHQAAEEKGINIHLTNMTGTEPTKRIPVTEFDIDENTNEITKCPGGHVPTRAAVSGGQTTAHFPHGACANCEFREQCYSKTQVKNNVVRISLKTVKASNEREKIKEDQKENTSMRAGIEGTNSALKRKGQDKLDVRGITKCRMVSGLKTAAQNIKRFIKYKQGGYKEKTGKKPPIGTPMLICS